METIEKPVYSIERRPRWVKHNQLNLADVSKHAQTTHFYLLVDYQEQVKDREIRSYYRSVQKVNALSRVEEASLFLRDLRPGNERLIYHRLDVYRNGRRFRALNADNIQVFRRETSLHDHVINHRLTVSHSMDDLRVGDVIDIQATLVEQAYDHPTAVKHHLSLFWLNWNCHVVQQKIRIINRSSRSLNLHQHRIEEGRECDSHVELKPKQECERHYSDLAPKSISNTAPAWLYTDFLQVSPAITWAQLSREFNQVYNDAARRDADLDCSEIDRIELTGNHRTDALRIIRFVQNDIRYLSECDGIYSHTPKPPRHVLRRGAGDCKGKSNLLVVLLRSIGVEANPALVHSGTGRAMGDYTPAANHFNHVILRVVIDGRHYYFDPTLQHQAGGFEHSAQLEYGFVLNLTARGEELCALPRDLSRKLFEIDHRFNFRDAMPGCASITVTRRYHAQQADRLRAYMAESTAQEIQDNYLERAERDTDLFLETITPFQVVMEDTDRDLLVTRELYRINDRESISDGVDGVDFGVTTNFHLSFPYPDDKRFELQITARGVLEHSVEVLYARNVDLQPCNRQISNPYFEFCKKSWAQGGVLNFHTRVSPLLDVVGHDDIERYFDDAREMYQNSVSRFQLQADTDEVNWREIAGKLLKLVAIFVVLWVLL
jgi:hypothetical protein